MWQEHRVIGPDNDMHSFYADDEWFVLVFDDYPTTVAGDVVREMDVAKVEPVPLVGEGVADGALREDSLDRLTLRFGPGF